MFKWLFGWDKEEAEEEKSKQIDQVYREGRLKVSVELLRQHLKHFEEGEDNLPEYLELMAIIREDMKALGLKECVLSLDNDLLITDNSLNIVSSKETL
jgi:hypothetical protein